MPFSAILRAYFLINNQAKISPCPHTQFGRRSNKPAARAHKI